jgi:RNA polymerase sigma factor (sigma-70 family)
MGTAQPDTLMQHIKGLAAGRAGRYRTDHQLLDEFAARGDQSAFAGLVGRHGPMVLRVCRRVLRQEQDAEDAFQATFLVLARHPGSIRKRQALASWLHGVAYRTAMKAKRGSARRRNHEARLRDRAPSAAPSPTWDDVQAVLDEEMQRLPDSFRSAFVLCVLDGKTVPAAAAELGVKEGTLSWRLARARQQLRRRLARRGIELSAVLAALSLAQGAAKAAVPTALAGATVRFGLSVAAGEPAAAIPSQVAALAGGVTRAMSLTKATIATAVALAVGLLIVGAAAPALQAPTATEGARVQAAGESPPAAALQAPATSAPADNDAAVACGVVLRPDDKPATQAQLWLAAPKPDGGADLTLLATADERGRFRCTLPAVKRGTVDERQLVARAAGFAADWADVGAVRPNQELKLKLAKAGVGVRGRVLTLEGKPVGGAKVSVQSVATMPEGDLSPVLKQWALDADGALRGASKRLRFPAAAGLPRQLTTDAAGRFEVNGVGDDRLLALKVDHDSIEHTSVRVVTRAGFDAKSVAGPDKPLIPGGGPPLYGPRCDHVARPALTVVGAVRDSHSGKPIENVRVTGSVVNGWPENTTSTTSDAEGRYRLVGLPKSAQCRLTFTHADANTTYFGKAILLRDTSVLDPVTADAELARGVVVTGRVTDKETGRPVPGRVRYAPLQGNKTHKRLAGLDVHADGELRPDRGLTYPLDPEGRFRFVAPPGLGVILAQAETRAVGARPFTQAWLSPADLKRPFAVTIPNFPHVLSRADGLLESLQGKNAYRIIDPADGTESLTVDFALDPGRTVMGRVADGAGKAIAGAFTSGLTATTGGPVTLTGDSFVARALDPEHPRLVGFIHREGKLAGTLLLRGDEKEPPVVRLRQWGSVVGKVVDTDGAAVAEAGISPVFRDMTLSALYFAKLRPETDPVRTDGHGRFRLDVPFADQPFVLVPTSKKGRPLDTGGRYENWTVSPGKEKELPAIAVQGVLKEP